MMKVVIVGAGNLATNLGKALFHAGHNLVQVYSRTSESATALADIVGASSTNVLDAIVENADAYIIALKDDALSEIVPQLCKGREESVFIHTAGSISMDCFSGVAKYYGVLYPMQTFTKTREVDFNEIPCFLEYNGIKAKGVIESLAGSITSVKYEMSSDNRKFLHLSAVWACNFVNHCYDVSSEILKRCGMPFDVMLPLLDETARKVHLMSPREAQTGPAVRYDENVIRKQAELLKDTPIFREIYEMMSISINKTSEHDKL